MLMKTAFGLADFRTNCTRVRRNKSFIAAISWAHNNYIYKKIEDETAIIAGHIICFVCCIL